MNVHCCHRNRYSFFSDCTSEKLDTAGCATAFEVKMPTNLGLSSFGCNAYFDHRSNFLCSVYIRCGFVQRTSCALA